MTVQQRVETRRDAKRVASKLIDQGAAFDYRTIGSNEFYFIVTDRDREQLEAAMRCDGFADDENIDERLRRQG